MIILFLVSKNTLDLSSRSTKNYMILNGCRGHTGFPLGFVIQQYFKHITIMAQDLLEYVLLALITSIVVFYTKKSSSDATKESDQSITHRLEHNEPFITFKSLIF